MNEMGNRIVRRVGVLEDEERSRRLEERSSLATTFFFCRKILLAHYLGDLKPDDEDPSEAEARALNYQSRGEYLQALLNGEKQEINKRSKIAARRLFAQAGLDFDRSPSGALFASFLGMINKLPEQWSNWLQSHLQEECRSAPTGSNTTLEFFPFAAIRPVRRRITRLTRYFSVFTQIKPLFSAVPEDLLREEGKADFWAFRRCIDPTIKPGWWQQKTAKHLQQFQQDHRAGKRPKLVLLGPPQHGKSKQVRDFIAWMAGKDPELKTIFTSYSDELCSTANLELQRTFLSPLYRKVFYRTRVRQAGERNIEGARRNTELIEYIGHKGSFRNTTVDGQITGFGLDIGVIDDPIKGWAEAQSKAVRDRTWNWVINDFYSRFDDRAGVIIIATRWHVDDPTGRWLEKFPDTKVLSFAAIAENADDWTVRAGFRRVGEALFPEHKTLEFLRLRQKVMTEGSWQALYQQKPIISGGGVIPIEKLRVLPYFDRKQVQRSVRYFDKAGTEGGQGAYTAGVLMHKMFDGSFVISHVARGHWGALEREKKIKALADADGRLFGNLEIGLEQEPGSGGKESAEATVRNLAGKRVFVDRVTGSKEVRAEPFVAQCQNDNVRLVAGEWIHEFLNECEAWPAGARKDQVDAAAGAFNRLASGSGYTLDPFQPGYVEVP